jgi:hypothetical protein
MAKSDTNQQQDIKIKVLQVETEDIKEDIKEIKTSLTNHIPTQIRELAKKIDAINEKILWGFIVMIAGTMIIQFISKLL